MRGMLAGLAVVAVAGGMLGASLGGSSTFGADDNVKTVAALHSDRGLVERLGRMPGMRQASKPGATGGSGSDEAAGYTGNDTCQWANDGECDDPGIGTGACAEFTDYSDCWRIATGVEDDSCQWANDGECDEPHFGTGACTQATDQTDCGAVSFLRNQNDSCETAFNGICEEPGEGNGTCTDGTDRGDCLGRNRPMEISDHFFGHDDRMFMDTSIMPWLVVGTLTDENGGQCTATLIAEDVIVTAAHCIEYGSRIDATGTFATGFDRPGGPLTAQVIDFYVSPERRSERNESEEPSNTDWALLRIDTPLGRELGYLGVLGIVGEYGEDGAVGQHLYQAGYSWDTGEHLSGNTDCEVVFIEDVNKIAHNCDTTMGDSGSPIMVRDGDDYLIVAVDSTYRIEPGVPASNIATRADEWVDLLDDFVSGELTNGGVTTAPASKPGATFPGQN